MSGAACSGTSAPCALLPEARAPNPQQPSPPAPPPPPRRSWEHSTDGYYEACGGDAGNVGTFTGLTAAQAQSACCVNPKCAGFSWAPDGGAGGHGSGYYKANAMCGFTAAANYQGFFKAGQVPSPDG